MRPSPVLALLAVALTAALPSQAQTPQPPVATVKPTELTAHDHVRTDDYFWLRDRDDPEVIAYLTAENDYFNAAMAPLADLQETLFEEIKGRIKQDDASVPYRLGDHQYFYRYEEGKQYPIYARRPDTEGGTEEIVLDVNALAEGHEYYGARFAPGSVSPNGRYVAWAADTTGRRINTIYFKDLETGDVLPDVIPAVTGNLAWANDNRTLFYSKQDPVTLRSDRIYRHTLGTDAASDVLVYEETDDTFNTYVGKSTSKKYLIIGSSQTLATEYRVLDADDPDGEWRIIQPRRRDHEYHIDHLGGHFYIRTNLNAQNYRLMRAPEDTPGEEHWEEVIPHRDDVLLEGFDLFDDFLVLSERKDGLTRLRIRPWDTHEAEYYVAFEDPAYVVATSTNPNPDTRMLRFVYESPTTPTTTYDYDMVTRERTLLKQEPVLGGFDSDNYQAERLWAPARDGERVSGTRVPVTVVYRKDLFQGDGTNPLLLYGYGSYGYSIDPGFNAPALSLLDRGFVYTIAHIRGSQTLGRKWYDEGKLLKKKNTFTDFIDAAEFLAAEGYGDRAQLYAMGGSAGGLLMGAVINMRPDLFRGVVAAVPFVDVITTMLDDSIPLTTGEYDEWGNPNDKAYYDYILSYSPYDNVTAQAYPNLLVTTGLHDSQVQYWEPAKWVAKLRALKTDHNRLLLHTNMEAGHGGASGRFERYRETARNYAFLLDLARKADAAPSGSH